MSHPPSRPFRPFAQPDRVLSGLRVRSEIPLPDLLPWTGTGDPGASPADLTIRLGDGPAPDWPQGQSPDSPLIQIAPDGRCRFCLPTVATYVVAADGSEIVLYPTGEPTNPDLTLFLYGTVFAIVCYRRGLLPLHACCVETPHGAVAFAGSSGAGKSTLAATLLRRGFRLLADDVSVVDLAAPDGPVVRPGFPRIKLWQDALDRLDLPSDGLTPVRPDLMKFRLPVEAGFCPTPRPLRRLVLLSADRTGSAPAPTFPLAPLPALSALSQITRVMYRPRLMAPLNTQPLHTEQFLRLLGATDGLRPMLRPETPAQWDSLVSTLLSGGL